MKYLVSLFLFLLPFILFCHQVLAYEIKTHETITEKAFTEALANRFGAVLDN